VAVEGVDDPVVGEMVARSSITAARRRALAEAPRMLRLTEPLQRAAWELLLQEVERPVRTTDLARRLQVSREHLSRQFGAGGAPNLKRVIDLTRIACAAQLLANPGYSIPTVVRVLHFASASHLSGTARRIANVPTSGLGGLGPRGVLAAFVRGNTRSRMCGRGPRPVDILLVSSERGHPYFVGLGQGLLLPGPAFVIIFTSLLPTRTLLPGV